MCVFVCLLRSELITIGLQYAKEVIAIIKYKYEIRF